jgi:hypothetical protein
VEDWKRLPRDWMWSRLAVTPRSEPPWNERVVGAAPYAQGTHTVAASTRPRIPST